MNIRCLLLACALVLAGCSGNQQKAKPSEPQPSANPAKPAASEEKLIKTDVKIGKGPVAEVGDTVWVVYRGTLTNGTEFDSNMKEGGTPYVVPLGQGTVIKGWEEGIVGMKVGGERKLVIPPSLAYGSQSQEKIPANSTLQFDIKVLGLMKVGEYNVIDIEKIKPGTGTRTVKPGDKVAIELKATLVNGKVVQDTAGKPYSFTVGKSEVVSGIDKGVQGMKVGEVRKIIAPPMTAYANTRSSGVPPNSMIHFTVKLVSIS